MQRKIIHNIDYDKTSQNVPENSTARLMFYLSCVYRVSNQDTMLKNYTNYQNYAKMSSQDKQNILSLAYILSPEKFFNDLFLLEPELEPNFENDHYFIENIELEVDPSGNCARRVNKVMYFTLSWLENFYAIPMTKLSSEIEFENKSKRINFLLI